MSGTAVVANGVAQEPGEVAGGRSEGEDLASQWHAGKHIEDDGEFEGEEAEEGGDLREVGHEDVLGVFGAENAAQHRCGDGCRASGRFFFEDALDRSAGEPPAGADESLSDTFCSAEAEEREEWTVSRTTSA